ncbi:class I SAM-dependent methyltransferase [Hoeflea sp. TYP-13]|uniref:class I SAM-dependent methyltransferase n=1 Tax=Hoeflea sp. TYP-13 TaxID=3230023 RepID=UPI0034C6D5C9
MKTLHKETGHAAMRARDYMRFARAWVEAPMRTGAIAPSSGELARHMAFAAGLRPDAAVVELGPGTGVVTDALLRAGVKEEALTLVETNAAFVRLLAERFPKATIISQDAFATVEALAVSGSQAAAVVSSLPLYIYPAKTRRTFCEHALRLVGPYGRLVQFTYGPVSPISPAAGMQAVRSRRIWGNLPPATVWTYQALNTANAPARA